MGNITIAFSHEGNEEENIASEYALLDINLEDTQAELSAQLVDDIKEALETFWGYPADADILSGQDIEEALKPKIIIPKTQLPPM